MTTTDYSVKAAAIVDDIIGRSDDDLGPEDRDPLRVIVRIAFEVQEFLTAKATDADALGSPAFSLCFLARLSGSRPSVRHLPVANGN